jgi:hypothetical protein
MNVCCEWRLEAANLLDVVQRSKLGDLLLGIANVELGSV